MKQAYGSKPAAEFGPLCLKVVRNAMIEHPVRRKVQVRNPETGSVVLDPTSGKALYEERFLRQGLARRYINKQIGRIKRMFAWAVEEELIPVAVYQALACVKGLKRGKGQAREKPRVRPVAEAFVELILPLVPPVVKAVIEVQRLSGCRPEEVLALRPVDIDMTNAIWEYRPQQYKTEHRNDDDSPDKERLIFLGPKAQSILKPFLPLNVADFFSHQCGQRD